jgi:hypothetical protein
MIIYSHVVIKRDTNWIIEVAFSARAGIFISACMALPDFWVSGSLYPEIKGRK